MLKAVKDNFRTHIQTVLDKNVYDVGAYHDENEFPYLKLRLNHLRASHAKDTVIMNVIFTLDLFSKYTGEQEIIEMVDDLINSLPEFIQANSFITYCYLSRLQIVDDNETGTLRKHGIANFSFLITGGLVENEDDG